MNARLNRIDRSPVRFFPQTALLTLMLLVGCPLLAQAQGAVPVTKIDTGDTAWMLISAALVMLMTPGLALFYGGGLGLLGRQTLAVGSAALYAAGVTFVLLLVLRVTMGLRVTVQEEATGLDLTQHGETAYGGANTHDFFA